MKIETIRTSFDVFNDSLLVDKFDSSKFSFNNSYHGNLSQATVTMEMGLSNTQPDGILCSIFLFQLT